MSLLAMCAPYRSGDGHRQATCPVCKQADMLSRRQAGDHAAGDARDHRQHGPRFAKQAMHGKPAPAACPALGTGGTGSPALKALPKSHSTPFNDVIPNIPSVM